MAHVKTEKSLCITAQKQADYTTLQVSVNTEELETAAQIVQSVCGQLGVAEIQSTCQFSRMQEELKEILVTVEGQNTIKTQFAANISENI